MKRSTAFLSVVVLVLVSLFCINACWAEEVAEQAQKQYEVFDLGEIFVTAEKPPAVQDVAVTTEVTQEEIKATNSHTVAEALRYVPGVVVSTGRKNEPNVEIRGLDQSKTLILIDGVPYYETNYGKLDLNQIPVDNIAKIVVTKGGASVLYGPNAFAGVVNIITKKAAEKFSAEALAEIGDYGNYKLSLSNGMKVGIFSYWLNYIHEESDGWRMSDDFEPRVGTIMYRLPGPPQFVDTILEDGGTRNNSDFKRDSFSAKVGLEPKDGEYYLNFYYIDREKGMPPSIDSNTVFLFRPAFSQFARMTRYDDWAIDLSGQQQVLEQLTLKTKLFYHNHIDDYTSFSDPEYEDEVAVSTFKDHSMGGFITADYLPVEWDILRVALRYNVDSHKERDDDYLPFADRTSYTGSVALENEFNQLKNFSLVVGASYDFFNITKAEINVVDDNGNFLEQESLEEPNIMKQLNPMIGATYTLSESTRIFGSIARKVRFPTLQQLYSGRSGNPDLKPENTVNYTLGVAQSFSKNVRGELALFYHDISDYITRDAPSVLGVYENFAKISLAGFELTGEVTPMKALSIRAAYTFNSARDRSPGRVTDNVLYIPEHKIDVGAYYVIPYIITRLDLTGSYVGKTYGQLPTIVDPDEETIQNDDYFIMNCRISKVFLKNYEAYLAVNNIFDTDYEPEIGFPAPGRNFYVGLTARF
jgi:outer membrane receptor protein involved in Fe transport